jgi:predicted hotdog family 3-hydroxylacyl-ACP dehydratase
VEAAMTATKARLHVNDWTTVKFGDRDVQAQVVQIHHGWILARVNDPEIKFGFIMLRETQA